LGQNEKAKGMNVGFRFSSATPQFWTNLEVGKKAGR
jgi:hypothetical protein